MKVTYKEGVYSLVKSKPKGRTLDSILKAFKAHPKAPIFEGIAELIAENRIEEYYVLTRRTPRYRLV